MFARALPELIIVTINAINAWIISVLTVLLKNATSALQDIMLQVKIVYRALAIVWYAVMGQVAQYVILHTRTQIIPAFLVEEARALHMTITVMSLVVKLAAKFANTNTTKLSAL